MSRPWASFSSVAENTSHHLSAHPAIKLDSDAAAPARSDVGFWEVFRARTHAQAEAHARTHARTNAHAPQENIETNHVLLINQKVKW